MPLSLDIPGMSRRIARGRVFRNAGKLHSVRGLLRASLTASVGETCQIELPGGEHIPGEVVGFDESESQVMCYDGIAGLQPGLIVTGLGQRRMVPVGEELRGRVLDGIGRPSDDSGPLRTRRWREESSRAPEAMQRQRITQPLVTGQRAIDALLTVGRGQRIGLFAGSGVGKSTLLGEIAKGADADINVIALVGERGREVRPFIEDCLSEQGRRRSVVVVATSDRTPLMRIKAVLTAVTIAEEFRDRGAHVLFFLDSLTRLAMAQRELGLLLGEPPGSRGYPPSVQSLMAAVLERLGCGATGAITGIITVLVEGDDLDEPITDAARSILDGHIVLDRKLAAQGQFPAIDVLNSVSRTFREITNEQQRMDAVRLRTALTTFAEVADLIQMGAYKPGTSPQIDRAQKLVPEIRRFLKQEVNENSTMKETLSQLRNLGAQWPW